MYTESIMAYSHIPIRMAKIKKIVKTPNVNKNSEKVNHSSIAGGNVKWYTHCVNSLIHFYKSKLPYHPASNCNPGHLSQKNVCSPKKLYTSAPNSFS
jgi:hypothetical protein